MGKTACERATDEAVTAKCMGCAEDKGDCLSCLCVCLSCLTCFCFVVGAEIGCRCMLDGYIHSGENVNSESKDNRPPKTTNTMGGLVADTRITETVRKD